VVQSLVQAREKENQKHFDLGKLASSLFLVFLRQTGKVKETEMGKVKETETETEMEMEKEKEYQD
jgi:hypothetical protein